MSAVVAVVRFTLARPSLAGMWSVLYLIWIGGELDGFGWTGSDASEILDWTVSIGSGVPMVD